MEVELIDKMGSDLSVVNAARVSFNKRKFAWEEKDEKLIKYLAEHNHWSPFAHATLQFRIKAPIYVARQLVKHQVGLSWNEVSRRYVDHKPEFDIPFMWRKRPDKNIKQGSSKEEVPYDIMKLIKVATETYNDMLEEDIAPEMARMILPQNLLTEWIWSGTLYAFARVCNLRDHDNAQVETREVAMEISGNIKDHFPISWKYLTDDRNS
jgi:thymidylate synthase (FAD)